MSRETKEFAHRTSIFEGAYRAWSYVGSIELQALEDIEYIELQLKKHYFSYVPLPRIGLAHPFVTSILFQWLGERADEDDMHAGLKVIRTWWQHRRSGQSHQAKKLFSTSQLEHNVLFFAKQFFKIAHLHHAENDEKSPPKPLPGNSEFWSLHDEKQSQNKPQRATDTALFSMLVRKKSIITQFEQSNIPESFLKQSKPILSSNIPTKQLGWKKGDMKNNTHCIERETGENENCTTEVQIINQRDHLHTPDYWTSQNMDISNTPGGAFSTVHSCEKHSKIFCETGNKEKKTKLQNHVPIIFQNVFLDCHEHSSKTSTITSQSTPVIYNDGEFEDIYFETSHAEQNNNIINHTTAHDLLSYIDALYSGVDILPPQKPEHIPKTS